MHQFYGLIVYIIQGLGLQNVLYNLIHFDINLYNTLSKSHDEVWNWAQSVRLGYKHVGLHTSRIALPPIQGTTENNLTVRFNSIEHEREIFKGLLETFPEIKTRINLEM